MVDNLIEKLDSGAKVLIVDDSSIIRASLKQYLLRENYNVFEASSGAEVFKLLEKETFDALILDIEMPEMALCVNIDETPALC